MNEHVIRAQLAGRAPVARLGSLQGNCEPYWKPESLLKFMQGLKAGHWSLWGEKGSRPFSTQDSYSLNLELMIAFGDTDLERIIDYGG